MKCYQDNKYSVLDLFSIERTLLNYNYINKWIREKNNVKAGI